MTRNSAIAWLTPLLLAAVHPLFYMVHNLTEITPRYALGIGLTGLLLAALCYAVGFIAALPFARPKIPLALRIASLLAVWSLLFVVLDDMAGHASVALCGVLLAVWLWRVRRSAVETRFLFAFGAILSGLNLGMIAWGALLPSSYHVLPLVQQAVDAYNRRKPELPNVLYVIPDRYPSAQTLQRYYGFSNGNFLDSLHQIGFKTRDDSHANYTTTFPSLTSVLNMDYLPAFVRAFPYATNENYLIAPFNQNAAFAIFNAIGYRTTFMGGAWNVLHTIESAHDNVSLYMRYEEPVSNYERMFIDATVLRYLFHAYFRWKGWGWMSGPLGGSWQNWCDNPRYQERALQHIMSDNTAPQFIFWHLYLPHPPYIHDAAHEKCLRLPHSRTEREAKVRFLGQLEYTNRLLLRVARTMQAVSKRPLIIVFQADEGPYPWDVLRQPAPMSFTGMTLDELQIKFGNLNAIYMPSFPEGFAMPATPVNNFRLLFNAMLGTDFPLRDDRIWLKDNDMAPNKLHDITKTLIVTPLIAAPPPQSSHP